MKKEKVQKANLKAVLNFICESGMLKRVERSGWSVLGIKNAESVAEHAFRCAVIGYTLAHLEKARADKVLLMTLFNDLQEARISDLHKMAQRYINTAIAEDKAFAEQISALPQPIKQQLSDVHGEYNRQNTPESIIARDADILECLIQAREYQEHGFSQAVKFIKQAPRFLKTKSARKLWQLARKTNLNDWWLGLSEFRR